MILPGVEDLLVRGVSDPGVPNSERVEIQVMESVDLSKFGVLLGLALADGTALPMPNRFFWFGALEIPAPSWIVLYTGPGTFRVEKDSESGWPIYIFHWDLPSVIFHSTNFVPILFELGAVTLGENKGAPTKLPPPPPRKPPRLLSESTPRAYEPSRSLFEKVFGSDASVTSTEAKSLEELLGMPKPDGGEKKR